MAKLSLTIEPGGKITTKMDGFKDCSDKTKELIKSLDLEANDVVLEDASVDAHVHSSVEVATKS